MKKIIFIPLDERPCNYHFPSKLFDQEELNIVKPDISMMGNKKESGDTDKIAQWLLNEVKEADGLVLSIDTLLYGGIVPSRLHHLSVDEIKSKLSILEDIKKVNPKLIIYAFHLIMRCPRYSSDDEEPSYYETYGKEIFSLGYLNHRISLGLEKDESAKQKVIELENSIDKDALDDYLTRRKINLFANKMSIDYLKNNVIDFLIVPQDDSAPYGYTAIDQEEIRKYIFETKQQLNAYMYPGADEVGMTLIMRLLNQLNQRKPLIYVKYSSTLADVVIPNYEDRILNESVKYQILASGGLLIDNIEMADIILMINAPADYIIGANQFFQRHQGYTVKRNLVEFVEFIDYAIHVLKKPVAIGDVAFGNGSDIELIQLLNDRELLMKLASYAAWNTSSNTLGTSIPQAMYYLLTQKINKSFLALRYVEDAGYCGFVRQYVCDHDLEPLGFNYFDVKEKSGIASKIVQKRLETFVQEHLSTIEKNIKIKRCYMPWSRMFEVGLDVDYIENER
ncbi:DUF4127 family protein [Mycoplasmatota bacterium]|nr:DUF4127 family protein [Mycoplasmatota bacterium]